MNSPMKFIYLLLAMLIVSGAELAVADGHFGHQHRAHVHGHAQLTLAIENNTFYINLIAPADSLVGFEHQAETTEQILLVKKLITTLSNVNNIFAVTTGSCKTIENNIDADAIFDQHKHQHQHEQEKHVEHRGHAEVLASYIFQCNKDKQPSSAQILLFEHYPAIEQVDAVWITSHHQGASSLTAKNNVLIWQQ